MKAYSGSFAVPLRITIVGWFSLWMFASYGCLAKEGVRDPAVTNKSLHAAFPSGDLSNDQFNSLLDDLSANVAERRDSAESALLQAYDKFSGDQIAVLSALRRHDEAEVAHRVSNIYGRVILRRKLGLKVLQQEPGADSAIWRGSVSDIGEFLDRVLSSVDEGLLEPEDLKRILAVIGENVHMLSPNDLLDYLEKSVDGRLAPMAAAIFQCFTGESKARSIYVMQELSIPDSISLVVMGVSDPSREVRSASMDSIGDMKILDMLPDAIHGLTDTDPEVRWLAIEALDSISRGSDCERICKLIADSNEIVRKRAVWALGRCGHMRHVDVIMERLSDDSFSVRSSSMGVLAKMGASRASPRILERLRLKSEEARGQAAYALGLLGYREATGDIRNLLLEEDRSLRIDGLNALSNLGARSESVSISKCLKDPDSQVKCEAFVTLEWLGGIINEEMVLRGLKDPDSLVRWEALRVVGGGQVSITPKAIVPLLMETEEDVRVRAVIALAWAAGKSAEPEDVKSALERFEKLKLDVEPTVSVSAKLGKLWCGSGTRAECLKAVDCVRDLGGYQWNPIGHFLLEILTRRFERNAYDRYVQTQLLESKLDDTDGISAFTKNRGFRLVRSKGAEFMVPVNPGPILSVRKLLSSRLIESNNFGFVVTEGVIRIVPWEDALAIWSRRLREGS